MPPHNYATPLATSLVTHHHLHHSLNPMAGAHHAISCKLVGTATGPTTSPTHGVGWVDQTGVVADVRAVNVQHGVIPPTASPAARHHLCHSLNSTAGVHRNHVCELVGTTTSPPTAPVHGAQWVDHAGAVANVRALHSTSPLCNTFHCPSGRSSSPAPLC